MMKIPIASYRLQLTPSFRFEHVEALAEYFHDLGISHLYAAPFFASRAGSDHGYDVVEMNRLNDQLGGRTGFEKLADRINQLGLKWIQDIVPNHRAFDGDNPLLMDIFEKGPQSEYYRYFDIYWEHPYENIRGRVLAPFLGDFFGRCLERGEITVGFDERGFRVHYYERSFPLKYESYATILSHNIMTLRKSLGSHNQTLVKFLGIIRFFENIKAEREADLSFDPGPSIKKLLWELYQENEAIRNHIDGSLRAYNDAKWNPESYELLHALLSDQYFRLSYWKVGTEELNFRRFFSINDLICIRVEDEKVFEHSHQLVFELIRQGRIHGLRIDHLDGLYNPTQYVQRLHEAFPDLYVVVEKILEMDEPLPRQWPIAGTTGYDFLAHMNGVLYATENEDTLTDFYYSFTGEEKSYHELVLENKRLIVGKHMAGDIDNLALMLKEVANRYRFGMDLTLYSLRRALVEILTQFPLYRTYVTEDSFDERDAAVIAEVLDNCRESFPGLANELELIQHYLLNSESDDQAIPGATTWNDFLLRLQQYTGPVMAKGVEDTVFFIYGRAIGLNEVGGNPYHFGVTLEKFHQFNHDRSLLWPHAMNTTSTHDSKWGEDTRARMAVISELASDWQQAVERWSMMNASHKTQIGKRLAPTRNNEYILYQAMLGAMPFEGIESDNFAQRFRDYALKAAREAKVNTSWYNPNTAYEDALIKFIDALLDVSESNEFYRDFKQFHQRVAFFGAINSITQVLLKLTSPGVPDIYQGCEFWNFSLVDPDNRREVNFDQCKVTLAEINNQTDRAALIDEYLNQYHDGRLKMFVFARALRTRQDFPELFTEGDYRAMEVSGPMRQHVIAFCRTYRGQIALILAPRLLATRANPQWPMDPEIWNETIIHLPEKHTTRFTNMFDGSTLQAGAKLPVKDIFSRMPFAILVRKSTMI